MRKISRAAVVYVGYVFILLGFVSLGLFVAALAFDSSLASVAAVALVGSFAVGIVSIRASARHEGDTWTGTVETADVDRYLATYRAAADSVGDTAVAVPRLDRAA